MVDLQDAKGVLSNGLEPDTVIADSQTQVAAPLQAFDLSFATTPELCEVMQNL